MSINYREKLAEQFVHRATDKGMPLPAVCATPVYFLAQTYGSRFAALPVEAQREIGQHVTRLLGGRVGDLGPSAVGQVYA